MVKLITPVMFLPNPSVSVPLYVTLLYTYTGLGPSCMVSVAFCFTGVMFVKVSFVVLNVSRSIPILGK